MKSLPYKDREATIEDYFRRKIRRHGMALKFVSPGTSGVPDRILLLPKGQVRFVELKASGQKPRKLQQVLFRRFADLGSPVVVLDSKEAINKFIESLGGESLGV